MLSLNVFLLMSVVFFSPGWSADPVKPPSPAETTEKLILQLDDPDLNQEALNKLRERRPESEPALLEYIRTTSNERMADLIIRDLYFFPSDPEPNLPEGMQRGPKLKKSLQELLLTGDQRVQLLSLRVVLSS